MFNDRLSTLLIRHSCRGSPSDPPPAPAGPQEDRAGDLLRWDERPDPPNASSPSLFSGPPRSVSAPNPFPPFPRGRSWPFSSFSPLNPPVPMTGRPWPPSFGPMSPLSGVSPPSANPFSPSGEGWGTSASLPPFSRQDPGRSPSISRLPSGLTFCFSGLPLPNAGF